MPGWMRVSHVFPNATIGTPPFVTGLWLFAPDDATEEEAEGALSIVKDAYTDHLRPLMSAANGAGRIDGHYEDLTTAYDITQALTAPTGSGGVRAPGWAYRVVLGGARPPGGRPNQMYWPNPDLGFYDGNGTVTGDPLTDFPAWFDQIDTELGPTQFQWRNRHFVGTDEASSSQVSGATCRTSLSWLQRRYR